MNWNPFRRDKGAVAEAARAAEKARLELEEIKAKTPHYQELSTAMVGIRTRNSLGEKLHNAFIGAP